MSRECRPMSRQPLFKGLFLYDYDPQEIEERMDELSRRLELRLECLQKEKWTLWSFARIFVKK